MIKIIEHKDYKKPVDNETVVEMPCLGNTKKKLFKVFDGVWIYPYPLKQKEALYDKENVLLPYQEDYCESITQKSKYLEQMTILFKRINLSPIGQQLLQYLSTGFVVDFGEDPIWNSRNTFNTRRSDSALNVSLRVSCLIRPNSCYLENVAINSGKLKEKKINTKRGLVLFHPDCAHALYKNKKIIYFDPVINLYHELLHSCHHLYGACGTNLVAEEFLTFGHKDAAPYLDKKKEYYKNTHKILKINLSLLKNNISIFTNPLYKKCFQDKYGFTEKTIINDTFIDNYINKYLVQQSEYNFSKSLNLNDIYIRDSYKVDLYPSFKLDISDPKVYTVKDGFLRKDDTIERILANPEHLFTKLDPHKAAKLIFLDSDVKLDTKLLSKKEIDQELHNIIDFVVSEETKHSDPTKKVLSIWESPHSVREVKADKELKDFLAFKDILDYDACDADQQIDTLVKQLKSQELKNLPKQGNKK